VEIGTRRLLSDVSMTVGRGEIVAVVGESGCGKSTLLRTLLGILPDGGAVTGGTVRFCGADFLSLSARVRRSMMGQDIAVLFQEPGSYLSPIRRIGAQFRDYLAAHGAGEGWREIAVEALRRENLEDAEKLLSAYPFQLSGGMRQRVATAMTLALTPKLLLVDEPTSALDVIASRSLLDRLRARVQEQGCSAIFVTHNIDAAGYVADTIYIMRSGAFIECGDCRSVLAHPAEEYTRALLRAVPIPATA
jgi:hypothetical protein